MANKLKFNFHHIPTQGTIYSDGVAVKVFHVKDHPEMINGIIDNTNGSVFDKVKLKRMVHKSLELLDPKTLTIVEKE